MSTISDTDSRRDFLVHVGRLASTIALASCVPPSSAQTPAGAADGPRLSGSAGEWDLGWIDHLRTPTDRAVFDWPSLGDPADPIVLEIAKRYLDNCRTAYGTQPYEARAVLNIRTRAIPAAMTDALWEQYALGVEYNTKDPVTRQPATRNPFWHRAPSPAQGITLPTMADLIDRGAILLVCDFAMGHLSERLATRLGQPADVVHADLRRGLVRGAYLVPSGIFGLARAQNAGCAFVRM